MEVDFVCLFLLASLLTAPMQSEPLEKHKSLSRWAQPSDDMDGVFPKVHDTIFPTFLPFEASSSELLETSNGADGMEEVDLEASDERSTPVLLSQELLARLIGASEDKLCDVKKDVVDDRGTIVNTEVESVEIILETESDGLEQQQKKKEKIGGSADSEIPVDLDYSADAQSIEAQDSTLKDGRPILITFKEKEKMDEEIPRDMEDYHIQQIFEDPKNEQQEEPDQTISTENLQNEQILQDPKSETSNTNQDKESIEASLLGMTPVQIRAATNLSSRIKIPPKSRTEDNPGHEVSVDLCENVHCKRGKTCKLNDKKNPGCVCQEPADCPPTLSEFDHVCGTDNQTYNSSCQLFAIKCSLEGSKKGHRLHLDYTGSCKFIPPCLETELIYFPLRMKDWMKNVLLQLYKQDSLTAKQRSKVQKMYEDERRLHASYHLVKRFLVLDFEKNYSIYIYPVHWQFAQLDLHPSDRFLSHSELAPLRAPLVPMEHCTSVFFQACDEDKDKLLSFMEWCHCFGVRAEDMDSKLLF